MLQITLGRYARPLTLASLALALTLAGCGAPTAATSTPAPTAPPTSEPQATAPPTSPPQPTAPAPTAPAPTAPPTSPPQPTTGAGQTGAWDPDRIAAVQVVIDYYTAIRQQQFDAAYQLWAGDGAASGQTLDQFRQGYASTVEVRIQLGAPAPAGSARAIEVPATLIAISNDPSPQKPQKVQQYSGSYTVQPGASGWRLTSASIAATAASPLPPAEFNDPVKLLQSYYDLISRRQYATAYTYWGQNGANTKQTFAQFAQGFAATERATIELGAPQSNGAAGSMYIEIPALIRATQSDGSQQAFCGSYTLRRINVPPFDQLGLRIESATIAPTTPVPAGSAQAQQLLANGCKAS